MNSADPTRTNGPMEHGKARHAGQPRRGFPHALRSQSDPIEFDNADPNEETQLDQAATRPASGGTPATPGNAEPDTESVADALHWALDSLQQPAMAWADWLARDIDPAHSTAADLLSNPSITLSQVRQAKAVYKTMRIVGEKSADRRVGARMYAAAIAAGLVRHGRRISTQSDAALTRAFQSLLDDRRMPLALRDLAGMALCSLNESNSRKGQTRSKSA